MKKILFILAGLVTLSVITGCGSASEVNANASVSGSGINAGAPAELKIKRHDMIDYQGADYNIDIPQWVIDVVSGNKGAISPVTDGKGKIVREGSLPGTEKMHLFIATDRGPNLDMLRAWVDQEGIQKEVGRSFESYLTSATETVLEGNSEYNRDNVIKAVNGISEVISSVKLSGLEKITSFYSQFQDYDESGLPTEKYYEYYVVYGIAEDAYKAQMKKALEGDEQITAEATNIKNILEQKLSEEIIGYDEL